MSIEKMWNYLKTIWKSGLECTNALSGARGTDYGARGTIRWAFVFAIAVCMNIMAASASYAQAVTWTETDIGAPGASGSFSYASGTPPTYTVNGAGTGLSFITDSMAFVSTPACGNMELEANVSSQQNTGSGAIAGLCIRNSLQPACGEAIIAVTPGNGVKFYYRAPSGGLNTIAGPGGQTAPVYLRLARTGTATGGYTDSGYYSTDGINWTLVGSWTENNTNPLPNKLYAGFVVSSSVNGTLNTTVFDHVSYMTSVPQRTSNLLLWLRSDIGVTSAAGSVSAWADQSGNSNNATQSTGALQPTLTTGAVNSGVLPTITFDGSSQYLSLPTDFANLTAGTSVFVVLDRTTSTGTDVAFTCGNASNSNAVIAETTGTDAALYCFNGSTSSNVTTSSTPITTNSYLLLEETFVPGATNGTGTVYVNGTQEAQATNLVSTLTNTSRTSNLVGTGIGLANYFTGSIAEILVYNNISDVQRAMVESYVLSKYGVGNTPTLDAPTFSPGAGVFAPHQTTVASQDQNATVYYTVDGTTPTTNSLWFYTNFGFFVSQNANYAITVPQTETIKAVGVAPFFNNSPVTEATFQIDSSTSAIPRSGLVLWLKGDNSVSTSGSNVTSWGDVSGSGNSATNGSNQPTLVPSAINGLPAVDFSGSSQFLQVPAGMSNFSTGASIFLVTKPAAVTAGARFFDF
ncbi:MAG: chitobiase/beta-hexosaminidase C-terminal domain-containing protein, partial [Terriglobales bacterium]